MEMPLNLNPDFKTLFEHLPGLFIVLLPDFTILDVSEDYSKATLKNRDKILGMNFFNVFSTQEGTNVLRNSLERVLKNKKTDILEVQKINLPDPWEEGTFIEHFWSPVTTPVLNENGEILYLIHKIEDVTSLMQLQSKYNNNKNIKLESTLEQLRQSDIALNENSRRLNFILQSAQDSFVVIDSLGLITDWNLQAEKTFGWSTDEVIGKRVDQVLIPMRYREAHRKGLQTFLTSEDGPILGKKIEVFALKKNGDEIPVELAVNAVKFENKYIFGAFLKDSTERKKLELMQDVQLKISQIFAEASNLNTILTQTIELLCKSFHLNWGAFWQHNTQTDSLVLSCYRNDDNDKYRAFEEISKKIIFKKGDSLPGLVWMENTTLWLIDLKNSTKDFKRKYLAINSAFDKAILIPVSYNNQFSGVLEFFGDKNAILDQNLKKFMDDIGVRLGFFIQRIVSEELLRISEERFRTMILGVRDYAIFRLDAKGNIVTWNEGARRLKGYTETEIIGNHFSIFYSEEDKKNRKPEKELEDATLFGHVEDEGWRLKKNGTQFWANVVIDRINDKEGNLIGFSKVTRDLTERKRAEEALRNSYMELEKRVDERTADLAQALVSRDEFLLIASHELKTPLTSLKLRLQLAKRNVRPEINKIPNREGLSKLFTQSLEQVESLVNLVDDLLDVSRIQTGKFDLNIKKIDFSSLFIDVIGRFKEQFEETHNQIDLKIEEHLFLFCDHYRMEQVIVNLISNALKYAPGTLIEFSLKRLKETSEVRLIVKDHGPGIEKSKQEIIFQRFERLTSYQHVGGLGLGLFIIKKIIQSHKGSIAVESNPGEGAAFIVKLPQIES
jgi:PAS domain S-box-containing protein